MFVERWPRPGDRVSRCYVNDDICNILCIHLGMAPPSSQVSVHGQLHSISRINVFVRMFAPSWELEASSIYVTKLWLHSSHVSPPLFYRGLRFHALPPPINLLVLFQEQKSSNCMRPQPHKTRHPPPKHPSNPFILPNPHQHRSQPFLLLCAHNACLDYIHRTAHRSRYESCQKARREMCR